MSPKRSIDVEGMAHNAPIPMGARVGNVIYSSGIMGTDRSTGKVPDDGVAQVRNAFSNLLAFLEAAGAKTDDLVRVTVLLADDSLRSTINEEWLKLFPDPEDRPARHASNLQLRSNMLIQLEAVAVLSG
ncbi:MAG: RidA family protein [Acidimicrobiaceae bacterium]|nr:RidA family protein [Acidimicrobiaceae bacterium]MBO0747233.1 RidA family protein [Acidimicrobiaceae bacterium]